MTNPEIPLFRPLADLCDDLTESGYYVAEVSYRPGNPPHRAILHTGFHNGAYREIWSASYGAAKDRDLCTAVARVITNIPDMKP